MDGLTAGGRFSNDHPGWGSLMLKSIDVIPREAKLRLGQLVHNRGSPSR